MIAVADGDQSAFADLYDELASHVFAIMVLATDGEPEGATEQAMIEIWRAAPLYAPSQGSARSWCLKIAYRQAIRSRRMSRDTNHPRLAGAPSVPGANITTDDHNGADTPLCPTVSRSSMA